MKLILLRSSANQLSTKVTTNQITSSTAVVIRFLRQYSRCISVSRTDSSSGRYCTSRNWQPSYGVSFGQRVAPRKRNADERSGSALRHEQFDHGPMEVGDFLHDRQAQAAAVGFIAQHAIEALEDAGTLDLR